MADLEYDTGGRHLAEIAGIKRQLEAEIARVDAEAQKSKQKRDRLAAEIREIEAEIAALRKTVLRNARIVGATCTTAYLTKGNRPI